METASVVAPDSTKRRPARVEHSSSGSLGGFRDLSREHGFEPLAIDGHIPDDLRGTLWRTGPALFSTFGRRYDHWFDGDGGIYGARFDSGRVQGAARIVEPAVLREERQLGRALEGGYATRTPRRFSQLVRALLGRRFGKNPANTNVLAWQGRLYALAEAGLPHEVSAEDLSTIGESDLGGIVTQTFTAHPHRARGRASTWAFGLDVGAKNAIGIYELPDLGPIRLLTKVPLPFGTMIHDFAVTEHHLVFFVSPLRMRAARFLLGIDGFAPSLAWEPERGTEVIVVPIDEPSRVTRFHTDAFFQWHFAGTEELGEGRISIDLVRYPDFRNNQWLGTIKDRAPGFAIDGTFHRAVVDVAKKTLTTEERWSTPCEFPRTAPGDANTVYAASFSREAVSTTMPDRLARIDVARGDAVVVDLGAGRFPSEPVLVRKTDSTRPDDAYLLAHVYDARTDRTGVTVIDTARFEDGPIGYAWFDHALPFTFHGGFVR